MLFETHKSKAVLGKEVDAIIVYTDCGINITLAGGDKSHIGAVSVVDELGLMSTNTFRGHKETSIAEDWAKRVFDKYKKPVVVSVGIHFEQITKDQIDIVIKSCNALLDEIIGS